MTFQPAGDLDSASSKEPYRMYLADTLTNRYIVEADSTARFGKATHQRRAP